MSGKFAFLFPGQGSQSTGMMSELADDLPVVRETFSEASEYLGFDLWHLCQHGPEEKLNQTELTQPAMLVAGIATWRAWQSLGGPVPDAMAGHSLGEWSALVASGVLRFRDGVKTVALRGRLMQSAAPEGTGAMAAVLGLDDDTLRDICTETSAGEVVSCANFNSPGQVVIAGHRAAVERACDAARAAGARRALVLPVSVPSHCALMEPAAEKLAQALAQLEFGTPRIPVYHNSDVSAHTGSEQIREALVSQLYRPVRWTETIQALAEEGTVHFYECGPGKVLAGLGRRISRDTPTTALVDADSIQAAIEAETS